MTNIYVASSWRNPYQQEVVKVLREWHFEVYDFRDNDAMFHWRELDKNWQFWTHNQCEEALISREAKTAFNADKCAMIKADAFLMVMPCGRSAHLELGWAIGKGLPTAILYEDDCPCDPELMIKMSDFRSTDLGNIIHFLSDVTNKG